jgi:hypothetical protein
VNLLAPPTPAIAEPEEILPISVTGLVQSISFFNSIPGKGTFIILTIIICGSLTYLFMAKKS